MTSAPLSPDGALAWLQSLSIDLRAAAVLDASGAVLAGDAALGARAATALATVAEAHAVTDGDLVAVRSARHAVAASVGPHALRRLTRSDLAAAAEALEAS
jgi:MoxR-like ATPase